LPYDSTLFYFSRISLYFHTLAESINCDQFLFAEVGNSLLFFFLEIAPLGYIIKDIEKSQEKAIIATDCSGRNQKHYQIMYKPL
jgi:hypothetical protein